MREPNGEQRKVIEELDSNILLFASAGTGKTFTVANRVRRIIESGRATPEQILCLTFTIKAANEMKEDVRSYVGDLADGVTVKTIHGFCYYFLAEERKRSGERFAELSVCDDADEDEMLKEILSKRYYEWNLEEVLQEKEFPYTLSQLSSLPVAKRKGNPELFWVLPERNKLLSATGIFSNLPDSTEWERVESVCARCGERVERTDEKCKTCGAGICLTPVFPEFKPPIFEKKGGLRNFVSELKHRRERKGFFTGDPERDYALALADLKANGFEKYKNFLTYYPRYEGKREDVEFEEAIGRFCGRWIAEYDKTLADNDHVDFDDLVFLTNTKLDDEEVRSRWKGRYRYIVVDEMQDTSTVEYGLLQKLFEGNNVMFCGDFFQTIYGWRGSNPELVLGDFAEKFQAKTFTFSENYRSTKTLSAASFGYLKNTYPDLMGKYCPETVRVNSETDGEKIFCYGFDNREQESWQIYRYIARSQPEEVGDLCVMARSNKYIAALARDFERFNASVPESERIPFFTVEENQLLFKKPVVKDILAVLKLLVRKTDRLSMERMALKYIGKVGAKTLAVFRESDSLGVSVLSFLDPETYRSGDPFEPLLEAFAEGEIVVYDLETTGLDLKKDEAVQLSAVRLGRNGEVCDTLDLMIEPTVPIGQGALETHGFDLDYIRSHGGVSAKEGLERFADFCEGCVLVGHNNTRFDSTMVARQLQDNGLPPLAIKGEYDTLLLAKLFHSDLPNFKLATLCERFGIVNENAHNALSDILATGACLVRMIKENVLPTALKRRELLAKHAQKFRKFYEFIQKLSGMLNEGELGEIAKKTVEGLRLKNAYPTVSDFSAIRDVVQAFTDAPKEGAREFLEEYLKDASLAGSQMDVLLKKIRRVPIITVHQAKGCEFKTVIVAGADDRNFPSFAARESGNAEEEKKVFYVAITRAKERLILTRAMKNGRYPVRETPYFWKIPKEYTQTNAGWIATE